MKPMAPLSILFFLHLLSGGWRAFTFLLLPRETGYVATRLVQANHGGTHLLKIFWVRSAGGGGAQGTALWRGKVSKVGASLTPPPPYRSQPGLRFIGAFKSILSSALGVFHFLYNFSQSTTLL